MHLTCFAKLTLFLVFGSKTALRCYDAGDRVGYLKANIELSLQSPDASLGLSADFL